MEIFLYVGSFVIKKLKVAWRLENVYKVLKEGQGG